MPLVFSDLQESCHYLDIILQSTTRLITTADTTNESKGRSTASENIPNHQPRSLPEDERHFFAHTMLLHDFERWEESFLSVWQKTHESGSRQQLQEVATIRLRFLNAYLNQHIFAGDGCVYYGRFTSECTEVIDLCKRISTHSTSNPDINMGKDVSLDSEIIVPLATIGWRFRDRSLRREVMKLIGERRPVGTWGGCVTNLKKVLQWLHELEEDGLPDDVEYVPEER